MTQPKCLFQNGAALANCFRQPQATQDAHRVWPHQNRRAHFQQFRRLFKYRRLETASPQRQRRGQAANAAANDRNAH
jgi:hypothetical protein